MTIQYISVDRQKLAIVNIKESRDLLDYLEDLEDSLEALKRTSKKTKLYSSETIEREFLVNRIQTVRLAQGLKQKDLASSLGTSQAFISKIEGIDYRPSPNLLKKIARILRVSEEELL